jgi:TP901 family phage tail tape measure protein
MADINKTIDIIFGAVDRTGNTIEQVGHRLESVSSSAQAITGPMAAATDSILKIEAAIIAVGGAAATFTATQAAQFESGMVGIQKTTGITGEELSSLGTSIQDLAVQTGLGTNELTELGQSAGQLGVEGRDNILAFVETIGKLGRTSNISGDAAAKSLARILALSGETAGNVGQLADVIVELGNNLETSESELTKMAEALARNVSQFEVTSTEIGGMAGALSAIGARAEGAGTAIGRTFRAIRKSINQGGEDFRRLQEITGKTGEQLRQTFEEDATQVFEDFIRGIGESTQSTSKILDEFGIATDETLKVLGPLASDTTRLTEAMQLANKAAEEGTALQDEFSAAMESVQAQAERTSQAFNVAAQRVGAQFAPATNEALRATTNLLDTFGQAATQDNALGDLLEFLSEQLNAFAKELNGIAEALPEALEQANFDNLIQSFQDLGGSIGGLFDGLDLTDPQQLADALTTVSDGIAGLTEVTAGIVEALEPMLDALVAAGEGASNLSDGTQQAIGNVLGAARAIDTLAGALSGMSGALIGGGALLSGIGNLVGGLGRIPGAARGATTALGASGLLGTLTKLAPLLGIGAAAGASGAAGFALGKAIRDSIPYIEQYDKAWAAALGELESIEEAELNAARATERNSEKATALDELYQGIDVSAENMAQTVATMPGKIQDALDPTVEMRNVSDELRNKLREAFNLEPVQQFGTELQDNSGHIKQLRNDISEMEQATKQAANEGSEGMGTFRGGAKKVADQLENGVAPAAEKAGEAGKRAGEEAGAGMSEAEKRAQDVQTKLLEIKTEFANKAIQARVEMETSNLEAATSRIKSTLGGLEGVVDSTGSTITELWNTYTEMPSDRSTLGIEQQLRDENQQRQESIDLIQEQARNSMDFAQRVGQSQVNMAGVRDMTRQAVQEFQGSGGLIGSAREVGQKAGDSAEKTKEIGHAANDASKDLQGTQKQAAGVQRVLSETAARVYEANVKLNIAQAQAAAKAFESSMEGITGTVESTGDVLNTLFGNLTETSNPSDQFAIERAITKEQNRRERALELQEDLVRAQVDYYEARTDRLQEGDAEITVNADGLEPELEAFMWRIVERLHVKASQDEAEFLLGVNA